MENLFAGVPRALDEERIDVLIETPHLRLERIVSTGQATPAGQFYDQDEAEWVLLLRGSAGLRYGDSDTIERLKPGDHVVIPAHRKHRVEWTDAAEPTVWLTLRFRG